MDPKPLSKNLIHSIYDVIPFILRYSAKHTFIDSINIKSADSISLPIWTRKYEDFDEFDEE